MGLMDAGRGPLELGAGGRASVPWASFHGDLRIGHAASRTHRSIVFITAQDSYCFQRGCSALMPTSAGLCGEKRCPKFDVQSIQPIDSGGSDSEDLSETLSQLNERTGKLMRVTFECDV